MATTVPLQDGDALLVIVRDGEVAAHTRDIALSHAEFVRRTLGQLPAGAWVGTIRKTDGEVIPFNARTFYGKCVRFSNVVRFARAKTARRSSYC